MADAPRIRLNTPTLHQDQVKACKLEGNRIAIRCGRRWGKTDFGKVVGTAASAVGKKIGWFAPDYKIMAEAFNEVVSVIEPIRRTSSKVEGRIDLITGGRWDFWTLENERAGRSRFYDIVFIDEAAFTKANMMDIWEQSIEPTLLDTNGVCYALSNANGNSPENFFYRICNEPKYGFKEYHAPSWKNPHVPRPLHGESIPAWKLRRIETFRKLRAAKPPLVFAQEYEAEFVDWSGVAFFSLDKLLVARDATMHPVQKPSRCDGVFATVDTAVKTGKDNDGSAVIYWARNGGPPLSVLDWDIVQIQGNLLDGWLQGIFERLEELAGECGAMYGSTGVWIEDKASGMVLLQQAETRGWDAHPIDSKLTAMGKDERAISVSGYHHQGHIKLTQHAKDKVVTYKEATQNHLVTQLTGFRIGDKDAAKRADDLLDCYTYGISIALGNEEGW